MQSSVRDMIGEDAGHSSGAAGREGDGERDAAFAWFEREGYTRVTVSADEHGNVTENALPPVVALGPADADFAWAPLPEANRYPGKPLSEMSAEEYDHFMYRWLEAAVRAGAVRCMQCGKLILDDYADLPDEDTWDAILIEKELVAWMVVHFDCKKPLPKKLKGMNPFDLAPRDPPTYDLSAVDVPDAEQAGSQN